MGPKGGEASRSRPSSIASERRGRFTRLSFTLLPSIIGYPAYSFGSI